MAYLGYSGIIKLQRTSPEPVVVTASAVDKTSNYITVDYDDWLFAEEVHIIHSGGTTNGLVHRDSLDRIYLHTNRDGALSNSSSTRISLSSVNTSRPVIIAASSNSTQRAILASFQLTLSSSTTTIEKRLRAWPSTWTNYKSAATDNPWQVQGELRNWELSRTAAEIDVGSIGEKFGTYIKSTVSGSGKMDFIVDIYTSSTQSDVDQLLRLVQLTEYGSAGMARFYLKQGGTQNYDRNKLAVSSSLFFEASIILTACGISVATETEVQGSANFVTTGPIRLLSA